MWNRTRNSVHELIFKDVKSPPTVKKVWEDPDSMATVMDVVGGCDGRFVVTTTEASYILKGDDLEELVIDDESTGGYNIWALGDGWEIFFGSANIYGRGKSESQTSPRRRQLTEMQTCATCFRMRRKSSRNGLRLRSRNMSLASWALSQGGTSPMFGRPVRHGRSKSGETGRRNELGLTANEWGDKS